MRQSHGDDPIAGVLKFTFELGGGHEWTGEPIQLYAPR
jgi:hypothetical protein